MPPLIAKQTASDAATIRANLSLVMAQESERLAWLANDLHEKYLILSSNFDVALDPAKRIKLYDRLTRRFEMLTLVFGRLYSMKELIADHADSETPPFTFESEVAKMSPGERERMRKAIEMIREWNEKTLSDSTKDPK